MENYFEGTDVMLPRPFPTFRSVLLSEALVEHVLSQYEPGGALTCQLYSRAINDIYLVQAPQKRWMLRVTAANGSTQAAVQSEIDMLHHLDDAHIAVAVPVARRDGGYVTVLQAPEGARAAVLFAFVEQAHAQAVTPERAKRYGAALAQMHCAADTYPADIHRPPHDHHYFIEEPLARLDSFAYFAGHTAELAYLHQAATSLWEQTKQLPDTAPHYGFCHGDAKSDNALYGEDGTVTLIDFDYCGMGWRVYDLATYIWVQIVDGPELDWSKQDVFHALLEGYQAIRPLSTAEYEALPIFAALRQLFLFGKAIEHSPAFGVAPMTDEWLTRMVGFIQACQDGHWLARVGLR
jgi:Ser/Thr protein kinase RdoA (MazF antagonist)